MGGEGSSRRTDIERGDCLKRGLGQFVDLSGAWQGKVGLVFLRGVDTPMYTMLYTCIYIY